MAQTVKSFSDFMVIASCRSRWRIAAKTVITSEAKMTRSPNNPTGGSAFFATKCKRGIPNTYKPLIVSAQCLMIFNAFTDDSENAMFLSMYRKSLKA